MMAKMGEQNINEIWPADEHHRIGFDVKGRGFDTSDINLPKDNPRMKQLKAIDTARINRIIAERSR